MSVMSKRDRTCTTVTSTGIHPSRRFVAVLPVVDVGKTRNLGTDDSDFSETR